jgi:hypothetical protein
MAQDSRPATGRRLLLVVPALAVFAFCARDVLRVGFLADDYHAGEVVTRHVEEHPNVFERVATTFVRRWAPDLKFWHRPMVPLSFQLDYALFGANGQVQHVSNVLLWIGVAAAAAALLRAAAGGSGPWTWPAAFGVVLVYPAGTEALAWLAARDDLLFALFGLLALRARVAKPVGTWSGIPWLLPALFSKETAVVLIPLMNLAPLLVPGAAGAVAGMPRRSRILREAIPWAALVGWFSLRYHVLDGLGASYGPAEYFATGGTEVPLLDRIGAFAARCWLYFRHSFLQVVAPVNESVVKAIELSPTAFRIAFLGSAGVLLAGLLLGGRRGDLRRAAWLFLGVVAPLVLLSPVYCVSHELNGGRALAFPAACWVALLILGYDRARAGPWTRVPAVVALVVLFLATGLSFAIAVGPYVNATIAAEGALASLDVVPPGDELILARTHRPGLGMRGDLIVQDGAYVLSSGIFYALAPPFRPPPKTWITIPESDEGVAAFPAEKVRPWLATLLPETLRRPAFAVLAPGRSAGPQARLAPSHGATLPAGTPLELVVELRADAWRRVASATIVLTDLEGRTARAELAATGIDAAIAAGGRLAVPSSRLTPPIEADQLRAAGVRVVAWWAEGQDAGGGIAFRTAWQAIVIGR